jgi:hypothetical protein
MQNSKGMEVQAGDGTWYPVRCAALLGRSQHSA